VLRIRHYSDLGDAMARALYVVIFSRDSWWVDIEGKAHGPYDTRELAAAEAKHLAQFAAHSGRSSEVLVPDDSGRHRVVWESAIEYPSHAGFRAAE
jgi:hypothetical protein